MRSKNVFSKWFGLPTGGLLKILKSENLYNSEHMCVRQLDITVPRGLQIQLS